MPVGTYEQYKERLLAMKPNIYLHGKKIDRSNGKQGAERDLADWIVGGTYVMGSAMKLQTIPAMLTFAPQFPTSPAWRVRSSTAAPTSTTARKTC